MTLKLRVPKPAKALYAAARRVAVGEGTAADAARVRRARPGEDLVTAARVIVIQAIWHRDCAEWHA